VKACGLNHLDLWVRAGGKRSFPLPLVLGSDIAGLRADTNQEVVVFPGVWSGPIPRPGESVAEAPEFGIIGATRDGGMAELVSVPTRNCVPKPEGMSFIEAAALPVAYTTAYHMLGRAALRGGEWVLINAAGSGVSSAGIQIAATAEARVIATSSTPEKLRRAAALGAAHTVNYAAEDVAARVREITEGHGADVIFDHVGAANWEANMKSLAKGGRLVLCGTTAGAEVTLNLDPLYYDCQSILGSTLGAPKELAQVLESVAAGMIKPVIDCTFPLEEVADAHRYLEAGRQFGKVVIEVA